MAYLTSIDTSTLTSQNINTVLLAHTFTNTTRARLVYINLDLSGVVGNGDYIAHLTVQRAGAGDARETIKTTKSLGSGVTSCTFGTIVQAVGATDVIKVYVIGLAGDNVSGVTTITTVWEEFINVDASGNVTLAVATHTGAVIPTVTTLTNAPSDSSGITTLLTRLSAARAGYLDYLAGWSTTIFAQIAGIVDTLLSTNHGSGAWGAGGNGGALSLTYTLTRSDTGAAIDGATVELYSDASMTALVSSGTTNALGVVTFSSLLAGTYYLKRIKNGYTFTNPDSEVVA